MGKGLSARFTRIIRMFDDRQPQYGASDIATMAARLARLDGAASDAERIDRIRRLEELKNAAAAAQARETAAFADSQTATTGRDRYRRGMTSQVALARRVSPFKAGQYVGWSQILVAELPHTFAELAAGRVTEWRAMLVARETAWLSREHRAVVDAELAPLLEKLGDRRTEAEAKKIAYRLDPHGYVDRIRNAAKDRRVSVRPAPDVMARLNALLPVAQGVAAYAALNRHADSLISQGDPRSRGQIMADTLVERLTGQASAVDVPIEISLVMNADALLAEGDEPAHLDGYGPIPAQIARDIVGKPSEQTPMWIRRLFTRPRSSELAAMESRRRTFTGNQRRFVIARDQYCRTPYCEAPIRHIDHITPAEHGGPTSVDNAQGLCEACNYAKQAPGWRYQRESVTTPTGHTYAA